MIFLLAAAIVAIIEISRVLLPKTIPGVTWVYTHLVLAFGLPLLFNLKTFAEYRGGLVLTGLGVLGASFALERVLGLIISKSQESEATRYALMAQAPTPTEVTARQEKLLRRSRPKR